MVGFGSLADGVAHSWERVHETSHRHGGLPPGRAPGLPGMYCSTHSLLPTSLSLRTGSRVLADPIIRTTLRAWNQHLPFCHVWP